MSIIGTVDRLNRKGYNIPCEAGDILKIGYVLEAVSKGNIVSEPVFEEYANGRIYIGPHSFSISEYIEALKTCKHSKNPTRLLVKRLTGSYGNICFYSSEVLGLIGLLT